jgi:hypothetical protein
VELDGGLESLIFLFSPNPTDSDRFLDLRVLRLSRLLPNPLDNLEVEGRLVIVKEVVGTEKILYKRSIRGIKDVGKKTIKS